MSVKKVLLTLLIVSAVGLTVGVNPSLRVRALAWSGDATPRPASLSDRLSSEMQISPSSTPEADRYKPAVAYNRTHNEYLVVWHNRWPNDHRDIYARRVSATGQLLSWVGVSAVDHDRVQPSVAYNATNDEYLVVWMYNPSDDKSTYEIWGRRVAWNGIAVGPEFRIIQWANRSFWTPRVVWNSVRNEYLVIWNALDTTTSLANDVAGYRVSADGNVINPGSPIIITDVNNPHQADVVYNVAADGYLVVWRRMSTVADGDIWGMRLNGDGTLNGTAFAINTETVDQQAPAVATNGQDRYLVVWQHQTMSVYWDIAGQYLNSSGNKVGDSFPIAAPDQHAKMPDVVAAGNGSNEYLTVWEQTMPTGTAIWARRDRLVGNTTTPLNQFEVASGGFWENKSPAVAADRVGYLVVYEGDSTGDPTVYRHIYGRLWWPAAVYLPLVLRNY
ncbi:MAG: hypothetical protein WHX52_21770 [Anaerolineae bacterium]